jgi:D-glycero-beta-D-manno-heptose-7-phosphate kinase
MPRRRETSPHSSSERLLSLVRAFRGRSVAVIGDLLADEFIYGRVERVSREAPVLILRYDQTIVVPGGAGNAAANVAALGGRAVLTARVGLDHAGRRVIASLPRGVSRRALVRPRGYEMPLKTRILAGGVHSAKQQVVRIDRIQSSAPDAATLRAFGAAARRAARSADAVLISDYGSGLITPAVVEALRRDLSRAPGSRRVPILVDSRHETLRYHGVTACTPNESEVEQLLGVSIDDRMDVLERAGRTVLKRTGMEAVLITRGSRGMALFQPGAPTEHIAIFGSDEIADVTGAGDTVIATMTLALAAGATFSEAAHLANYAGGLVVMKRGTATVTPAELTSAIRRDASSVEAERRG